MTPLEIARQRTQERKERGEDIVRLNHYEKAKANPSSRRYAINAKCWDCSNEQRTEIKLCSFVDCPLYQFRPYK